jgi:hypothetical protein
MSTFAYGALTRKREWCSPIAVEIERLAPCLPLFGV